MGNLIVINTSDSSVAEDYCFGVEAELDRVQLHRDNLPLGTKLVQAAQGTEEISRLLLQFSEIKIIAVGAETVEEQIKALQSGAIGACIKESTSEEIELAIQAAIQDSFLVSPFKSVLVLPFAHRRKKLAKITASLGAKLLKDWRMQGHSALLPVDKFVQNLNIGDESLAKKLIAELDKLVESKKVEFITSSRNKADTFLQSFQAELKTWVIGSENFDTQGRRAVIERIGAEITQKRQTVFAHVIREIPWEEVGSFCLCTWMQNLVQFLRIEARKFEQAQQTALQQEIQALKALEVLQHKLQSSPNSRELLEGALNVLRIVFLAQVDAKISGGASQITFDLIDEVQGHLNSLQKSEQLLDQVQQEYSLQAKDNNFRLKAKFFSNWSSEELRKDFEDRLFNKSIHNLGITEGINKTNFKEGIEKLVYPYAFEIYINYCLNFFE